MINPSDKNVFNLSLYYPAVHAARLAVFLYMYIKKTLILRDKNNQNILFLVLIFEPNMIVSSNKHCSKLIVLVFDFL